MIGFLFKAIAISTVIILSGVASGAVIQGATSNSSDNRPVIQAKNISVFPTTEETTLVDEPDVPQLEFGGYPCTQDCSGHEAGYEWAQDKGIDDPDDCGGNSDSFIEGCQAYAEEMQTDYNDSYDDYDY